MPGSAPALYIERVLKLDPGNAQAQQNLQLLQNLFDHFSSLAFDGKAALVSGKIRADLHRQGNPIGPYDLQIGAIALANNLTLGDCPRIAIVARARLVERDFFDHLRRIVVLFNEKDRKIQPTSIVRSRSVYSRIVFQVVHAEKNIIARYFPI